MKVRINYDFWGTDYRAWAELNETIQVGISENSFEEAKQQLIDTLKKVLEAKPVPKPEEVEL